MAEFIEGELAVLQHASYFEEWDGALAVVVGPLMLRQPRNMHTLDCESLVTYRVKPLVEGAIVVNCQPYQLRKLPGPSAAEEQSEDQPTETLEHHMA